MNRFMVADSTLCIDYCTCEAACSEIHHQHGLQSVLRLKMMLNEKESVPWLCHWCKDAPCATVCLVNAISHVDGAVQLNESPYVSCKLRGVTCSLGAIKFSGSRPLYIPANANTPKVPPAPPALTRVSSLLGWVPDVRVIAVKYDLCSFNEQGPAYVRMCPTKALHLMNNMDIAYVSKRKRELTFNIDLSDLTLFQQVQSGSAKRMQFY